MQNDNLLKQARSSALVSESLNAVRTIGRGNWDSLVEGSHGLSLTADTWSLSGEADVVDDLFIRSVTVSDRDSGEKQIDVVVYWSFLGRFISKTASTILTDWKQTQTWGNWGTPIVVGSLDLGPQGQASGVVRENAQAFLTAEISSSNRPSFYSLDISQPTVPAILDSVVIGESLLDLVFVGDRYVYAVGESNELIVFDVFDPTVIQIVARDPLGADGLSITLSGVHVFVGTEDEILVYDVSSASSPVLLSRYAINARVNAMTVSGNHLYVGTSATTQEVMIISILDPSQLAIEGFYDLTGSEDALSATIKGTRLFIGTENNSGTNPELYLFDASDPVNLVLSNQLDIGGSIQQIAVADSYLYLATGSSNNEFQVWQLGSNEEFVYTSGINLAQMATGIAFDDNTIFLSLRSNDAFQIIQPSP